MKSEETELKNQKVDEEEAPRVVKTQAEVAKALGVSIQAVGQWRMGGMPGERGCYDLAEIAEWRGRNRKRPAKETSGGVAPETPIAPKLQYWEARFRQARAELNELQLAIKRGEYLPREEIESVYAARMLTIRQGKLSQGRRLAPRLVGKTRAEVLKELDADNRDLRLQFAAEGIPGINKKIVKRILAWIKSGAPLPVSEAQRREWTQ